MIKWVESGRSKTDCLAYGLQRGNKREGRNKTTIHFRKEKKIRKKRRMLLCSTGVREMRKGSAMG